MDIKILDIGEKQNYMAEYIALRNLRVYVVSLKLCEDAWEIYISMDWLTKKVIGEQFIRSVDSVSANIAEGYGRFHYLDRVKFYYNARGSLFEAKHWSWLLYCRKIINKPQFDNLKDQLEDIGISLNSLIKSTKNTNDNK